MECNKDEAIRAREIAEKKMQNNDFAAAKRFALKAQQLYSNLDSISMILAVCEVHCSAQNKTTGAGVNWYDVLQVGKIADETAIKKQYRKLALLLHPDKNKFSGAEAAFKLIGEANRVLSNKMTRSVFDSQVKASMQTSISAKPPSRRSGGSSSANKQQNSEDKVHQQNSPMFRQGLEKFWTRCPSCMTGFEYFKLVLRKQLSCQKCKHTFIAYEIVAPVSQSDAKLSQSECFSGNRKSSLHTSSEASGRGVKINRESNGRSVHNSMRTPPAKAGFSDNKSNKKSNAASGVNLDAHKKGPKSDERKPVTAKASRNSSKKRGRAGVVESSQSSGGVGDVDVRAEVNQGSNSAKQDGSSDAKRSSRNKRNASYRESSNDGSEFAEYTKLPEMMPSDNNEEAQIGKGSGRGHINGTSYMENVTIKKRLEKKGSNNLEENEVETFEDSDMDSDITPDSYDCLEIPDQEFYDFDKDNEKSCFANDQIWAVYDPVDAMPRFYAQIQKVCAPDFKLEITWLEPDTVGRSITKWIKAGLPTACGMFVYGDTEVTTDYLMFSHQMQFEAREKTFVIHPRSGEVWALFRNWNIGWANDPKKHESFKYDFVVILSNFDQKKGIEVAYLKKVKGFVSLFQQITRGGRSSFRIPPGNLLQFSHRVPHFQMSGNEREDVPVGSYELDAASLPKDFDEFDYFSEKGMEKEKKDTAGAASCKLSEEIHEEVKAASRRVQNRSSSENCHMSNAGQGSASAEEANELLKETSERPSINPATLVRRSPRVSKKGSNPNTRVSP